MDKSECNHDPEFIISGEEDVFVYTDDGRGGWQRLWVERCLVCGKVISRVVMEEKYVVGNQ